MRFMAAKCVLDPEEVEPLILDAIRKKQENKEKVDVKSMCKTLLKKHCLDDSTTTLHITMREEVQSHYVYMKHRSQRKQKG